MSKKTNSDIYLNIVDSMFAKKQGENIEEPRLLLRVKTTAKEEDLVGFSFLNATVARNLIEVLNRIIHELDVNDVDESQLH